MVTSTLSLIEQELLSPSKRRHWSPASQPYAPADVLLEYVADGWIVGSVVAKEAYWYGTGRHVSVYHFELTKADQAIVMPVLGNPVVRRLIQQRALEIALFIGDEMLRSEQEPLSDGLGSPVSVDAAGALTVKR